MNAKSRAVEQLAAMQEDLRKVGKPSPMTREEYDQKRQRLEADAEDARKALNRARARYIQITDSLRDLRHEWLEQQATDRAGEK
jgi:hypothetical protein